jgi:diguanylate cyclase (GGDEF)-like protein
MSMEFGGRGPVRFVLSQVGAGSFLLFAVLLTVSISMLFEQQTRDGSAADMVASQTQLLEQLSRLGRSIVLGNAAPGAGVRIRGLVHRARANQARLAADVPEAAERALAHDLAEYTDAALGLIGDGSSARYRMMIDVQLDLMQRLALVERQRVERSHRESDWAYAIMACAIVALLLLLVAGWRSIVKIKGPQVRRDDVVPAGVDVQARRIEELYLIVASSGIDSELQIERALAYARTSLGFEWALALEWLDGEEPVVTSAPGTDLAAGPADAVGLESAIAIEASRSGGPVTYRFDRLPAELAPLAELARPFPWRHCAAYAFPGDYAERAPHCAVFLASRRPRVHGLSKADLQLLRLIGTLVASSGRSMRHQKRLDGLAFADPLTGMANRAQLQERLEETLRDAQRSGAPFALHYVDLDGFKRVNDEHGHEVGDEVLKIAAKRMEQVLRPSETLARIGGDEFVIIQAAAPNRQEANEVAHRLIERLSRPFTIEGRRHRIGGSIGIAMYPEHGTTTAELLRHADAALYASKRNGKGCATFYQPMAAAPGNDVVA